MKRAILTLPVVLGFALFPGSLTLSALGAAAAVLLFAAPKFGRYWFAPYAAVALVLLLQSAPLLQWQPAVITLFTLLLLDDQFRSPGAEPGWSRVVAIGLLAAGLAYAAWIWPPTRASLYAPDSQAGAILVLAAIALLTSVALTQQDA